MKTYKIVETLTREIVYEVLAVDENEARSLAGVYSNRDHVVHESRALNIYERDDDGRYRLVTVEVG
jgi:hypothetical protein